MSKPSAEPSHEAMTAMCRVLGVSEHAPIFTKEELLVAHALDAFAAARVAEAEVASQRTIDARIAQAVRAEREACAQIAEAHVGYDPRGVVHSAAAAIRAGGCGQCLACQARSK